MKLPWDTTWVTKGGKWRGLLSQSNSAASSKEHNNKSSQASKRRRLSSKVPRIDHQRAQAPLRIETKALCSIIFIKLNPVSAMANSFSYRTRFLCNAATRHECVKASANRILPSMAVGRLHLELINFAATTSSYTELVSYATLLTRHVWVEASANRILPLMAVEINHLAANILRYSVHTCGGIESPLKTTFLHWKSFCIAAHEFTP